MTAADPVKGTRPDSRRVASPLAGIDTFVFDLDNTLYPAEAGLFTQIHARMNLFLQRRFGVDAAAAAGIRRRLYLAHGTTLRGLMVEHGVEPAGFLAFVHDVDFGAVLPDPRLVAAVGALPGRRFVFTNADAPYARLVLERIGFGPGDFEAVWDIVAGQFVPKPAAATYHAFLAAHGVDPRRTAFFEDQARNLVVPKALGMVTVLVEPSDESAVEPELAVQNRSGAYIDLRTRDLCRLLADAGNQDPAGVGTVAPVAAAPAR